MPPLRASGPFAVTIGLLTLLLTGCATSPTLTPNAKLTALPASYAGTFPCADCPGIDNRLNLLRGHAFLHERHYQVSGVPAEARIGRWQRDTQGRLVLRYSDGSRWRYAVLDNGLTLERLDREGKRIDTELNYRLQRQAQWRPITREINIAGMVTIGASGPLVRECLSGRRFPVANSSGRATLERIYNDTDGKTGKPMKMTLSGHIDAKVNADTMSRGAVLRVTDVAGAWPAESCGQPFADIPLTGTHWRATRLDGNPLPADSSDNAAHLRLQAQNNGISGSNGCNAFSGHYERSNQQALAFPQLASTLKACPDMDERERTFMRALEAITHYRIRGSHLLLIDDEDATRLYLEAAPAAKPRTAEETTDG